MNDIQGPGPPEIPLTIDHAGVVLRHWLGYEVDCLEIVPLDGGFCSAVYRIVFNHPPFRAVCKLWQDLDDNPLPRERERLIFLKENTDVPCPEVYLEDDSRTILPFSFLLMESLPGANLESARLAPEQRRIVEEELAEILIGLHAHHSEIFHEIGVRPGTRCWQDVMTPVLEEGRRDMEGILPNDLLKKLDKVLSLSEDVFRDQGEPTLIHNDVWAGNIIVSDGNNGWHISGLVDPVGLRYADVEKELAYLEAFHTVGEPFFEVYEKHMPRRSGYERRKLFYWLDTYMLHVYLGFGSDFKRRISETCDMILRLV